MNFVRLVCAAVAVLAAQVAAAQVTITSASRVIGVSSAFGNDSATNGAVGPWTRNLVVPDGGAQLVSEVSPSTVSASFTYGVGSAPGGPVPVSVLQMQVTLEVVQTVGLTLTRSQGPNVSTNFSFSGPGITIGDGTPPGLFLVTPGTYLLQYSMNGVGTVPSAAAFNVAFAPPPVSQTAFTYQGKLSRTGGALPAAIDLTASFFGAASGGSTIAPSAGGSNVPVAGDGSFTVLLDPGVDLPTGAVWLELSVRPAGGGAFTLLTPRQLLTPAPKARTADTAVFATSAGGLDAQQRITLRGQAGASAESPGLWLASPPRSPTLRAFVGMRNDDTVGLFGGAAGWGLVLNTASAFVGVGTDDPRFNLHAVGSSDTQVGITSTSLGGRTWSLQSSAGTYGPGSPFNGSFQLIDRTLGVARVLIDTNGNMGVNNTTPQSRLHVGGAVRADSFVFSTPVTSTVTIGETAWRSRTGASVSMGLGNGGAVVATGDQFGLMAEVQVPQGATITNVTVYVTDNETAVNLSAVLFSTNPSIGGLQQLSISALSSGASGGIQALAIPPTVPVTVGANTVYRIDVVPSGGNWAPNLRVRGATLTYTLPRPAQ
jgi:hypothetical protein